MKLTAKSIHKSQQEQQCKKNLFENETANYSNLAFLNKQYTNNP